MFVDRLYRLPSDATVNRRYEAHSRLTVLKHPAGSGVRTRAWRCGRLRSAAAPKPDPASPRSADSPSLGAAFEPLMRVAESSGGCRMDLLHRVGQRVRESHRGPAEDVGTVRRSGSGRSWPLKKASSGSYRRGASTSRRYRSAGSRCLRRSTATVGELESIAVYRRWFSIGYGRHRKSGVAIQPARLSYRRCSIGVGELCRASARMCGCEFITAVTRPFAQTSIRLTTSVTLKPSDGAKESKRVYGRSPSPYPAKRRFHHGKSDPPRGHAEEPSRSKAPAITRRHRHDLARLAS